ncbi:hypothetical protein [Paenibacillus sp. NFR01]|uniref:hypothetical protein n=1 Tax=Paenibacillus sp. NFR01 TaxID=1566279 RepID=UPI0008AE0B46|nr:hypothetical protein [Paenibacillus sp. NFR01]SET18330.1 hypothetical protein SAMN03159358_0951 [Paenibacillus sp. NFR01]
MKQLNDFKDSLGIFWDIFLLFAGAAVPGMFSRSSRWLKNRIIRFRLRNTVDMEHLNILKICSANPKYEYRDINTRVDDKELYIGFPEEFIARVKETDPDFHIHSDCSFDGSPDFQDIVDRTEIGELKELIAKHRALVADNFVQRANGCLFNRPKFGIYDIRFDARKGHAETPAVKIEFFKTDYFTHRVFRSIYNELKAADHPIAKLTPDNLNEGLQKYNAFTTSLGINAFVMANAKGGESVIFSKRSVHAAYAENRLKYNSTVMEGVSLTDCDTPNNVSLEQAVYRALMEELGLTRDLLSKYNTKINYCDFFLEKNYFEIGLTASVTMNSVFEETIRDLPAQDRELEIHKLHPVRKTKKALEKFIHKENIYPQGVFTLKMIMAREMIFLNLRK